MTFSLCVVCFVVLLLYSVFCLLFCFDIMEPIATFLSYLLELTMPTHTIVTPLFNRQLQIIYCFLKSILVYVILNEKTGKISTAFPFVDLINIIKRMRFEHRNNKSLPEICMKEILNFCRLNEDEIKMFDLQLDTHLTVASKEAELENVEQAEIGSDVDALMEFKNLLSVLRIVITHNNKHHNIASRETWNEEPWMEMCLDNI